MIRELFEKRVLELMQPLYYVSCTLLQSKTDREDALQSCLEKALRKCESLRDETKLKSWVTRILINECHNIMRAQKRVILAEEIPLGAPDEVDVCLRDAVVSMPERLRLPFVMQVEGYSVREISRALHMPEGTVKLRLREAKLALREQLREGEEAII